MRHAGRTRRSWVVVLAGLTACFPDTVGTWTASVEEASGTSQQSVTSVASQYDVTLVIDRMLGDCRDCCSFSLRFAGVPEWVESGGGQECTDTGAHVIFADKDQLDPFPGVGELDVRLDVGNPSKLTLTFLGNAEHRAFTRVLMGDAVKKE